MIISGGFCSCIYLAIVVGLFRRSQPIRVAAGVAKDLLWKHSSVKSNRPYLIAGRIAAGNEFPPLTSLPHPARGDHAGLFSRMHHVFC